MDVKNHLSKNKVYYCVAEKSSIENFSETNVPECYGNPREETQQAYTILYKLFEMQGIDPEGIELTGQGKPYFPDHRIYFNYSHSANHIIVATAPCRIGVDIEEKGRHISDAIADRFLSGAPEDERLETWVKKEAYCKMHGQGIDADFTHVKILDIELEFQNKSIDTEEYFAAIIVEKEQPSIEEVTL